MSDEIPHELIEEIFARLPVKTLLRFKCISKSWQTIIDSPYFIKKHLNHSSNHTLILGDFNVHPHLGIEDSSLYTADYSSFVETDCAVFEEVNLPAKPRVDVSAEILGSCDGLLCLLYCYQDRMILWNPSTTDFHRLSVPEVELPKSLRGSSQIIYGFGYDSVNDDYKVVSMLQIDGVDEVYSEVKVYSLKLESWKKIPDFPYYFYWRYSGKLANGALHWLVKASRKSATEELIAAFDLGTEEYRLLLQPEFSDRNFGMRLGVLGGCLCMTCDYTTHFDIWVMEEYGFKESWTNLISIKGCDLSIDCTPVVRPIAYSRCGRRLLLGQHDQLLLWYDLEKKSVSYPVTKVRYADEFCDLGIFVQSLVKLSGGSCRHNKETQKRKRKRRIIIEK